MTQPAFARLVELLFTAYAVPALLVPAVWLAGRVARFWSPLRSPAPRSLVRASRAYGALAIVWLVLWGAVRLGVPIEKGGVTTAAACWAGYAAANLALAWLLVRFTADYGSLADGREKDRLFLRLLGAVVAQPVLTAVAFSVLFRVLGVADDLRVPGLPPAPEGL